MSLLIPNPYLRSKTVGQGFNKLKQNLEITGLQRSTVSTRQQNVRQALESELTVLDSFLTGSYARSTMIAPLKDADIDVFVVLSADYHQPSGQAALLDQVKRVLKKTYPSTPKISRNKQAVTITFKDFKVDVVPGFNPKGGGYLIPDSSKGRWISTDPKKHVDIWTRANKNHNGEFVPVVKMIKAWNKTHGAHLRSFHLETLVLTVLDRVTISNYPSAVRYVFDKARTQIQTSLPDPAGYGGDVGDYLTWSTRLQAKNSLETAYDRARSAEQHERDGRISEAYQKWRLVFGDYFPAYA